MMVTEEHWMSRWCYSLDPAGKGETFRTVYRHIRCNRWEQCVGVPLSALSPQSRCPNVYHPRAAPCRTSNDSRMPTIQGGNGYSEVWVCGPLGTEGRVQRRAHKCDGLGVTRRGGLDHMNRPKR